MAVLGVETKPYNLPGNGAGIVYVECPSPPENARCGFRGAEGGVGVRGSCELHCPRAAAAGGGAFSGCPWPPLPGEGAPWFRGAETVSSQRPPRWPRAAAPGVLCSNERRNAPRAGAGVPQAGGGAGGGPAGSWERKPAGAPPSERARGRTKRDPGPPGLCPPRGRGGALSAGAPSRRRAVLILTAARSPQAPPGAAPAPSNRKGHVAGLAPVAAIL